MYDGTDASFSFAPVGLGGRTVEVCRVHFVADGRDGPQNRDARLRQVVEDMVAAVTRRIDAYLSVQDFQAKLSFGRIQFHPGDVREIALKLRILPRLTGNGVVVVILPITILRTFLTVLPDTIGSFAHPLLALHHRLRIVEADTHQVDDTIEVVVYVHIHTAIGQEPPGDLVDGTMQIVDNKRAVVDGEAVESTLIGIL